MTSVDFPLKSESGSSTGCSLPLELEREIFETAAVRYPTLIPTILLVCHRVHAWVEPPLYRVLSFSDSSILLAAQNKSAEFLQNAVRHVLVCAHTDSEKEVLRKCSRATNVNLVLGADLGLLFILDKMRLQRLYCLFDHEPPLSTLQRPLFRFVTHLDLYIPEDKVDLPPSVWQEWSHLASLPALSHLCLSQRLHADVLPRALAECAGISIAVAAFWDIYDMEDAVEFVDSHTIRDPRFVVMVVPNCEADWNTGARGGADFWVRAEEFLARKRRGEIESSCYFLKEQ
ncbi:hypothetical protein DFH06DRAFT_1226539 [Mycena polygramma]|nr:hypothetical protein DFH06DRAFT_1226539 [Mycena polygramma]